MVVSKRMIVGLETPLRADNEISASAGLGGLSGGSSISIGGSPSTSCKASSLDNLLRSSSCFWMMQDLSSIGGKHALYASIVELGSSEPGSDTN
ncbi:unnamed protein product [Linum trigynum]|uniref:Uncharacterized protein n=1 Tax=Linum trigynum TaxID=586398 RepID=A0AAV2F8Q8_9ROSI